MDVLQELNILPLFLKKETTIALVLTNFVTKQTLIVTQMINLFTNVSQIPTKYP